MSSDLDPTGGLTTPVPDVGMSITGEAELENASRKGFWSTEARLPEVFVSGQEEEW